MRQQLRLGLNCFGKPLGQHLRDLLMIPLPRALE
jgi:hypothetical protein